MFSFEEEKEKRTEPQNIICPGDVLCALEKNVKSAPAGWNGWYMSVQSIWSKVWFTSNIYLFSEWPIHYSKWILKSSTMCFSLTIVGICLIYSGTPMLGTFVLMIVIYSWWIDLFIIARWPSLLLVTIWGLKSILSDMSITAPALFWFPLTWNIFLPSLHFEPMSALKV